jgi:hypothetical protein
MMTKTRAQEILDSGDGFSKFMKYTADEHKEVCIVWGTMPGWTTWYMALERIANGRV